MGRAIRDEREVREVTREDYVEAAWVDRSAGVGTIPRSAVGRSAQIRFLWQLRSAELTKVRMPTPPRFRSGPTQLRLSKRR